MSKPVPMIYSVAGPVILLIALLIWTDFGKKPLWVSDPRLTYKPVFAPPYVAPTDCIPSDLLVAPIGCWPIDMPEKYDLPDQCHDMTTIIQRPSHIGLDKDARHESQESWVRVRNDAVLLTSCSGDKQLLHYWRIGRRVHNKFYQNTPLPVSIDLSSNSSK